MFAKTLHRYHHLGEKLVAHYYIGWTCLARHGDGEADLAWVPVRACGGGYPCRLYAQMAMLVCEHGEIGGGGAVVWLVHQHVPMTSGLWFSDRMLWQKCLF